MNGTVDELESPLWLLSLGVPCWVVTKIFGHNDMFWHRHLERLDHAARTRGVLNFGGIPMRKLFVGLLIVVIVVVIAGGAFFAGVMTERHVFAPHSDPMLRNKANDPRRNAFLDYLDGKTLPLSVPKDGAGQPDETLTIDKTKIQAVDFEGGVRSGDKPWQTDATFIVADDKGQRYSFHGDVKFRNVENTVAIIEFTVTEVAKQ